METVEDMRKAFTTRYPEVDDDEFSAKKSGFVHENPITAIGIVLISSIVLGTCDPTKLAGFTKYSERFIRAPVMRVLTVPKSIAKSSENKLNNGRRLSREIRVIQLKRIPPKVQQDQVWLEFLGSLNRF